MEVNMRDNKLEKEQSYMKKQEVLLQQPSPPPPPTATTSPPSAAASPTHEFSFTISLHPHPPSKSKQDGHKYDDSDDQKYRSSSTTTTPSSAEQQLTAIDLSPADDIFFHGHLLPLHLLSHLPVSPRSSTNSMDSFTLPMKDILKDQHNPIGNTSFHYHHRNTFSDFNMPNNNNVNSSSRPKAKSFSFFGRPKAKKEGDDDHDNNNNSKKKLKLEVAQLIKRYMKMVRPLLSFQKGKRPNITTELNRPAPHSFSGNFPVETNRGGGRRRGEFSAPASMRTSPANSGILLASGTVSPAKSTTSDSTMEELQAAIQAAIAHCKNSIATEDKIHQV